MEHTPIPWAAQECALRRDDGWAWGIWRGGVPVAAVATRPVANRREEKANADFIVRAVNNHERLVKALKMAIPFIGMGEEELCNREGDAHKAEANALAAIAAAEGRDE